MIFDCRLLDEDTIIQICFVTQDAVKSASWFADLTGKPMPKMTFSADPDKARAEYRGKPTEVSCKIMMFNFGNIDLEFLEPGPEQSAWRDLLEERGPGCHHIAIKTRNLAERHAYLTGKGHECLQRGEFQSGTGRYAYYNTSNQLGALVELLEFDRDKVN
ncbi:VOC family protein (plasmid) [Agrobacterium rosae]|uniref:VOC family protein n=1 Tax=Agrobacterium rosae TaxID=1972867 RepID=A0ABU4W4L7_9HYPH|nr:VOC family protein [Agrobacterium rosae]MDX8331798.1 VOC family protein [Agrobacterium rosae]